MTLLQLCRAVVFPSHLRSEAFGMTLVEGAMFGKPLISTEIGTGTSFINISGETGLVVKPDDPVSLNDAILTICNNDELTAKFGAAAKARYEKEFTGEAMGRRYAELYHDLIKPGLHCS